MKNRVMAFAVVASTLGWLAVWTSASPFGAANGALDRAFGALPGWSKVKILYRNPETQETTTGAHPLGSLRRLAQYWSGTNRRVVFIGNSQMQAVSLARGEAPPSGPEQTWVDQVAQHFQQRSVDEGRVYRLSAAGMSYTEALWYGLYLAAVPAVKPQLIFIQMNYQFMWNTGVRESLLELLEEPAFRRAVEQGAARGAAYSGLFAELLEKWRKQRTQTTRLGKGTGVAVESGLGARLETGVRRWLVNWPGYQNRGEQRDVFLDLLYRERIYFLQLRPSTARSLSAERLAESHAAIETLADLCRRGGIRLVFLRVPVNPKVSLYRAPEDKTHYEEFLAGLSGRSGVSIYNLEDAVPAEDWGLEFNGPDPLHLGRAGHRLMAGRMIPVVARELAATP